MKTAYRDAIEDPDNPVVDVNAAGGTVLTILLQEDDSDTTFVDGSTENVLLYLHGMRDFLEGNTGALLSHDPTIALKAASADSVYHITVEDRTVQSLPSQADDVLLALKATKEDGDLQPLVDLHREIIDTQVRRDVVNRLLDPLPNLDSDRVTITSRGWVIDGFYVLDWTASLYVQSDDGEAFRRGGGSVQSVDKSHEFVDLSLSNNPQRKLVKLDGEKILLGKKEMRFLSKARWLMERTKYHQDSTFWRYAEQKRKEYLTGHPVGGE